MDGAADARFSEDIANGLLTAGKVVPDADQQRREQILTVLDRLGSLLVRRELDERRKTTISATEEAWVMVRMFGSSALQATVGGADLDTVMLLPDFVSRQTVFEKLPPLLREYASVDTVATVNGARVPLLKFEVSGVEVDLVVVLMSTNRPPTDVELRNESVFDVTAADSRLGLQGLRLALTLTALPTFNDAFRSALRGIKSWAKGMYQRSQCTRRHWR